MKENKVVLTIKKVIILMVGLAIAHAGVSLFISANLGSDPFNVFIQGLFRTITRFLPFDFITHGRVHIVISILIIIILLIVDRSYIKIGTILCMVFGGPFIDLFNKLYAPMFDHEISLAMRVMYNVMGCIILANGMSIVIKSQAGTGPNDLVALVISDKIKKKFSIVRIIVDICFAGIGFALGGKLGIGTIICAFLVGPVAGIMMPVYERIINKDILKIESYDPPKKEMDDLGE
ncbi:MAG: DUF6198 family protein [Lachnospiraceae bacterium]|nr:DUF6198 family protein [Lachnospiraceae bacterium]